MKTAGRGVSPPLRRWVASRNRTNAHRRNATPDLLQVGFAGQGSRPLPRRYYQLPVFSMEAQGSALGLAGPFWSNSMEMPSGDLTKAMLPSRGGRLIVTPLSIRCWQVA